MPKIQLDKTGEINAIVKLPDGGFILGGSFSRVQGKEHDCIARINPDGSLDDDWNPKIFGGRPCVSTLILASNHLYVGGNISRVDGKSRRGICRLDVATGKLDPDWYPVTEGDNSTKSVYAMLMLPGGNEMFIGGNFTKLGKDIQSIAKVSTLTGDVDPDWDPGLATGSQVRAMALSGNNLYIGGYFTAISGVSRNYLAKVSADGTGALDMSWNPDADSIVSSLVLSATGDKLYAGGSFREVGGISRKGIVRMDASGTGQPDAWDPAPVGIPGFFASVSALSLSGNSLYVGGQFAEIGGQNRNNIARLNTSDATADSWNPDINKKVHTLLLDSSGNSIHVGGEFFTTGAEDTLSFVSLETASDDLAPGFTDLNIGKAGAIRTLARHGNALYFGGDFVRVNGQPRFFLGRINTTNGQLQDWGADLDDSVRSLVVSGDGSALYLGGDFKHIGAAEKNHLAKLASSDASVLPGWNPSADGSVRALLLDDNDLYVGGRFYNISGGAQHYLARLAADTGVLDSGWNPEAGRGVDVLVLSGNDLYAGGIFHTMGGSPRNRLAKLNAATGAVDAAWTADANDTVRTLLVKDGALYVGGHFTEIGGASRNRIARLSTSNAVVDTSWNPDADSDVFSLAISPDGNDLYMGGWFSRIGGHFMPKIAKVTTSDATLDRDWNLAMSTSGVVSALMIDNTGLYAGGEFARIGGKTTSLAHIVGGHRLTVSATAFDEARRGVISSMPEGIRCSPYTGATDCEHALVEDDYTLTATSGSPELTISQEWTSGCDSGGGTSSTCGVTLDADKAVAVKLSCEQYDMLPPDEPVTANRTVRCREIKAVRGYEIGDGARLRFEAKSSVELGPGFRVSAQVDYFVVSIQ
ncbi:hypothetical protein [Thiolapillus sp.]